MTMSRKDYQKFAEVIRDALDAIDYAEHDHLITEIQAAIARHVATCSPTTTPASASSSSPTPATPTPPSPPDPPMKLLPLPKPDGAPLECSVEYATHKCNNPAQGLLTEEDYQQLRANGYPAMRAVCREHFELTQLTHQAHLN